MRPDRIEDQGFEEIEELECLGEREVEEMRKEIGDENAKLVLEGEISLEWDVESLVRAQREDPLFGPVIKCLKGEFDKVELESKGVLPMPVGRFSLEDGVLYVAALRKGDVISYRTAIPRSFVSKALFLCHATPFAGHLGIAGTIKRVEQFFYWPKFSVDCKNYVRNCHLCQMVKSHRIKHKEARLWPIPNQKFERVHLDLIGPLPTGTKGEKYILTMVDALTRYCMLETLLDKTSMAVAEAVKRVFCTIGPPKQIISDCGREFIGKVFQDFVGSFGSEHKTVIAYRPSSNGWVESKNKLVVNMLRYFVQDDPANWPSYVPTTMLALNTAYHRSIGDSPHFLVT